MTWKGRGNNKVQCDRTGAIVHASDCKMTWDGLFVLKSAWYARQPQDTIRPIKEQMVPAVTRPIGDPAFILTPQLEPQQISWADGTNITWGDGQGVDWSTDE